MCETVIEVQPVKIDTININTRIDTLRTDADESFSITELGDNSSTRLFAFARWQIETCPLEVMGSVDQRDRFLASLWNRHPFDSIPVLIVIEPMLMLSNLTNDQLTELTTELWSATKENNSRHVLSALRIIQGILIGRESADLG